ncbi:hypothetical protein CVT25_012541 [Psilocybe cyanescens]|uniref:Uncharacterized protein n=1 Tax=Psilocybe cyanescens TaxID=93625 RepID=A0A409X836_PSICY|nr:hypothetical protein CVT25_012541 [Psilocybe cyanescens]
MHWGLAADTDGERSLRRASRPPRASSLELDLKGEGGGEGTQGMSAGSGYNVSLSRRQAEEKEELRRRKS